MWVNTGLIWALRIVTQQLVIEDVKIGLYTNAVAWNPATVFGDLVEPVESGYAQQLCSGWNSPIITGGNQGDVAGLNVTFTDSDVTDIVAIGFFYIGATTGTLLGGDQFVTPQTIPNSGGILLIQPQALDTSM